MFTYFNAFMKGYMSGPDITIRPAQHNDLSDLSDIHSAGFQHGWSDGDLGKMLDSESYDTFVAHPIKSKGSKPFGFVFVRSVQDEAEIITIATSPKARRKGIGRQLMRAVVRKLEYDRKKKLFLEVDEENTAAVKLYQSLGFIKVGERQGYYMNKASQDGKKSTALVMQLELG
jgi:ribosomal-protein-alanine N-acetyltransferase